MFRIVLDANIILASTKTQNLGSPNREILDRWHRREFSLLYTEDIVLEYIEKLIEHGIDRAEITAFAKTLRFLAELVEVEFYHLRHYPIDADDVAFLLCADNANASHLLSYDQHLTDLRPFYEFSICAPTEFLMELRAAQSGS
jgi:predicted nucleic acid-binding protein